MVSFHKITSSMYPKLFILHIRWGDLERVMDFWKAPKQKIEESTRNVHTS